MTTLRGGEREANLRLAPWTGRESQEPLYTNGVAVLLAPRSDELGVGVRILELEGSADVVLASRTMRGGPEVRRERVDVPGKPWPTWQRNSVSRRKMALTKAARCGGTGDKRSAIPRRRCWTWVADWRDLRGSKCYLDDMVSVIPQARLQAEEFAPSCVSNPKAVFKRTRRRQSAPNQQCNSWPRCQR